MDIERIRERVSGDSFKPFALKTSYGRVFKIRHPRAVLIGSQSLAVLAHNGEIASVDPVYIVSLKDLPRRRNRTKAK